MFTSRQKLPFTVPVAPTGVPSMHQAVIPALLDVGRWPRAAQHKTFHQSHKHISHKHSINLTNTFHTNIPSISQTHFTQTFSFQTWLCKQADPKK